MADTSPHQPVPAERSGRTRRWESPEQVDALNLRFLRDRKEPPPVPAGDRTVNRAADAVTVFGGLLVTVSVLLPWIVVTDGYGRVSMAAGFEMARSDAGLALTLGAAAVAAGIAGLAGSRSLMVRWGPTAIGVLTAWMAVADMRSADGYDQAAGLWTRPGAGLWLLLIGSGIVLIAGLTARSR